MTIADLLEPVSSASVAESERLDGGWAQDGGRTDRRWDESVVREQQK